MGFWTASRWKSFSATLALPVALATLGLGLWQVKELRAEFKMSGPVVAVSSQLQVDADNDRPTPANMEDSEHPVADFDMFDKYKVVWLRVTATNNGRSDTTIRTVRMEVSPDNWVAADKNGPEIWCQEDRKEPASCLKTLPYLLHPASTLTVFFPLSEWRNNFAQTKFGHDGVPLEVFATGVPDQPVKYMSGVHVQLS